MSSSMKADQPAEVLVDILENLRIYLKTTEKNCLQFKSTHTFIQSSTQFSSLPVLDLRKEVCSNKNYGKEVLQHRNVKETYRKVKAMANIRPISTTYYL